MDFEKIESLLIEIGDNPTLTDIYYINSNYKPDVVQQCCMNYKFYYLSKCLKENKLIEREFINPKTIKMI